jgi:isocitrate dehydrogenase
MRTHRATQQTAAPNGQLPYHHKPESSSRTTEAAIGQVFEAYVNTVRGTPLGRVFQRLMATLPDRPASLLASFATNQLIKTGVGVDFTATDESAAMSGLVSGPLLEALFRSVGISLRVADISLPHRVLAALSQSDEYLPASQRVPDELARLGKLVRGEKGVLIKLPNISATVRQLMKAIGELQAAGYDIPNYPENPKNPAEVALKKLYDKVLGSAVNPVVRYGNSDREIPGSVLEVARTQAPPLVPWTTSSKAEVATMSAGCFGKNEISFTSNKEQALRVEFVDRNGQARPLEMKGGKSEIQVHEGEVFHSTYMSMSALRAFLRDQIERAKSLGLFLSFHVKVTMMKYSDPPLLGEMVKLYYARVFEAHGEAIASVNGDPKNGFADILSKLEGHPDLQAILDLVDQVHREMPELARASSGQRNLDLGNLFIVDASMAEFFRSGGVVWTGKTGERDNDWVNAEALAVVPDSTFGEMYATMAEDLKAHGTFDRKTAGNHRNLGLMALEAEEYGSHPNTVEAPEDGTIRVVDASGQSVSEHAVEKGDIWRACGAKDPAIRNWVQMAVNAARENPDQQVVFWLDEARPHDAQMIRKVEAYMAEFGGATLPNIRILSLVDAVKFTNAEMRAGRDTISVTGNVLRDYLTDLYPLMLINNSFQMTSKVPMLNGAEGHETGAGGTDTRNHAALMNQNHMGWGPTGEILTLPGVLGYIARTFDRPGAGVLAEAAERATGDFLKNAESTGPMADTRVYWFQFFEAWVSHLASQNDDPGLRARYRGVLKSLDGQRQAILQELIAGQGKAVDLGGHHVFRPSLAEQVMRCSPRLNAIIESI